MYLRPIWGLILLVIIVLVLSVDYDGKPPIEDIEQPDMQVCH